MPNYRLQPVLLRQFSSSHLFLAMLLALSGIMPANATVQSCERTQVKAAGLFCSSLLNCQSQSVATPSKDLAGCVSKAEAKFAKNYRNTLINESKHGGRCNQSGDVSTVIESLRGGILGNGGVSTRFLQGWQVAEVKSNKLYSKLLKAGAADCASVLNAMADNAKKANPKKLGKALSKARRALVTSSTKYIAQYQKLGSTYQGGQVDSLADAVEGYGIGVVILMNGDHSASSNHAHTGAVIITGIAQQGHTLNADTSTLADADGLGSFSYQWKADGLAIAGANGITYLLTDSEVGKTVTVNVSYVDGLGNTENVASAATAPVSSANNHASTGIVTISGTAQQGQTLIANTSDLADPDGLGAFSYQWKANGFSIDGAKGSSYLLTASETGTTITVTVSYIDCLGNAELVTSAPTAVVSGSGNHTPTGSVIIHGMAQQGQTLQVDTSNLADADGLRAFDYQWMANGIAIGGATDSTYLLTVGEVGKLITVAVSYTDGLGTAESIASAATAAVSGSTNHAPSGSVTISGTAQQGQTLQANISTLNDADGLGTFSYQWKVSGIAIGGATHSTYLLTAAEVGKSITVAVSYTDGLGTAESIASAATAAVSGSTNHPPTGSVIISGVPAVHQMLLATSTLSDADGLGAFSYQWNANDAVITGAVSSSYIVTAADIGKALSVIVSYTDGRGTKESMSSASIATLDTPEPNPVLSGAQLDFDVYRAVIPESLTITEYPGQGASLSRNGCLINLMTPVAFSGDLDSQALQLLNVTYNPLGYLVLSINAASLNPLESDSHRRGVTGDGWDYVELMAELASTQSGIQVRKGIFVRILVVKLDAQVAYIIGSQVSSSVNCIYQEVTDPFEWSKITYTLSFPGLQASNPQRMSEMLLGGWYGADVVTNVYWGDIYAANGRYDNAIGVEQWNVTPTEITDVYSTWLGSGYWALNGTLLSIWPDDPAKPAETHYLRIWDERSTAADAPSGWKRVLRRLHACSTTEPFCEHWAEYR